MMKLKDEIRFLFDKDNFGIGGAGINKVRKTNILAYISGIFLILIIIFFIILNRKTNYSKLDDFEDYLEDFESNEVSSNFGNMHIGIKIMPSYNLEKNVLYMHQTKRVSL